MGDFSEADAGGQWAGELAPASQAPQEVGGSRASPGAEAQIRGQSNKLSKLQPGRAPGRQQLGISRSEGSFLTRRLCGDRGG